VVTLVHADMRHWEAPEKTDILVSELLGSFGDNELSPECLDGAQRFLKEDGVSIPQSCAHPNPTLTLTQRAVARVPGRRAALPQGGRRQHPAVVRLTLAAALHNHPDRRRALMHHHPFVMVRVHTVSRTLLPHHRLAHCVPSPSLPLSLPLCLSLTLPRDSLTGTRATWRP
jgi:hypothetical protein